MNGTGRIFRVSIFGESHGPALGVTLDGIPPGLALAAGDFKEDLGRRKAGAPGTTPRVEDDEPEILSGLFEGRCSGAPLCIIFRNKDTRPSDYDRFKRMPRPGHADFSSSVRYRGFGDPRGSGHFSGRVTAGLVAAGVVAKKILDGARFSTRILEAGGSTDLDAALRRAADEGDSIGALVELRVTGIEPGLGEPFFEAAESRIAANLFAVPAVRGVEFGDGFAATRMRGSEHNDPYLSADGRTAKNGAGGVNGGITNGNELVMRVAVKPASTIAKEQETFNFQSLSMDRLSGEGRHDTCIALRAMVALEAACALALADLYLIAKTYTSEQERKLPS